jgi:arylsulfatase A-like enzyme
MSNPPSVVNSEVSTLADILGEAGYNTKFVTAVGTAEIPIRGRFHSTVRKHDEDAETTLKSMSDWWNQTDGPRFGYVQLGDLHEPLQNPGREDFGSIPEVEGIDRWRFGETTKPEDEFHRYRDARELLYDTVLRSVDEALRQFVTDLGVDDETILIVTSDHGEELWDHVELERTRFEDPRGIAGIGHGHALVPAVLSVPVFARGTEVATTDHPASTTDLVPTVLRALDAETNECFDGAPLQTDEYARPVLSEEIAYGPNQISVTARSDHLIHLPNRGESLLLDFDNGRIKHDHDRVEDLESKLPETKYTGKSVELDAETKAQLSDLGYT